MEKLRKAEEQGKQAARNAFERAKEFGEDAERRMRQKMRIYPPKVANGTTSEVSQSGPAGTAAATGLQRSSLETEESEQAESVPIVSVHARDVGRADKVA
jgi:hypothetical protein